MPSGKPQTKLSAAAAASDKTNEKDHTYAEMEVTATSALKRKDPPSTPTKSGMPPPKVKSHEDSPTVSNEALVKAIDKLTEKIDGFGTQLRENSVMVANISKAVEINAAEIKECKEAIQAVKHDMPHLIKDNENLKQQVMELERYKRRWNLKIHGLKEKDDERIRDNIVEILSKIAPQRASIMETVVDTVHRLGRSLEGRHRQVIIQFTMRHYRDAFWKLSKNCKICKDLGIQFKQDLCKADREARAAAWPQMEQARAAGKNVYFRGHVGYINGNRVIIG